MQSLKGKVGVVTGAASGIGLALCERFVVEGMQVVLADVEEATLAREVRRLEEAGASVQGVACDVRDADQVVQLAERTLERFGAVHVVCNNAGVAPAGPMLHTTAADWRWTVEVNFLGVAYGVSTFAPLLVEAGEGHIVNTASEAGLATNGSLGMYCATKHGVVGLSESLYRELEDTPVGVSCLCPSLVKTKIFESERNRDDGAALLPSQVATLAPLREAIAAVGIPADKVATDVVQAILEDRFWVLPHDTTRGVAASRFRDLEGDANPSDPYAHLDMGIEISLPGVGATRGGDKG